MTSENSLSAKHRPQCVSCGAEVWWSTEPSLCAACNFKKHMVEFAKFLSGLPQEIKSIGGTYDGGGDSGDVQDTGAFDQAATDSADQMQNWYDLDCAAGRIELDAAQDETLRDFLMELVNCRYGGWENNEGASGNILIDCATQRVHHCHVVRIEEEVSQEFNLGGN